MNKKEFEKEWKKIENDTKAIYVRGYEGQITIIYANKYVYENFGGLRSIYAYRDEYLVAEILIKEIYCLR